MHGKGRCTRYSVRLFQECVIVCSVNIKLSAYCSDLWKAVVLNRASVAHRWDTDVFQVYCEALNKRMMI